MTGNEENRKRSYHRSAVVITAHPTKPLEGKVVCLSDSHEIEIEDDLLSSVIRSAHERFDIESYANELRLGTVYFDTSTEEAVGVLWDESPFPYNHGDFDEPVDELPTDLRPINCSTDL